MSTRRKCRSSVWRVLNSPFVGIVGAVVLLAVVAAIILAIAIEQGGRNVEVLVGLPPICFLLAVLSMYSLVGWFRKKDELRYIVLSGVTFLFAVGLYVAPLIIVP